eukprot:1150075-Rhodomonas_salina.2
MDESRSEKARGRGAQQFADGASQEKGVDGRPVEPTKGLSTSGADLWTETTTTATRDHCPCISQRPCPLESQSTVFLTKHGRLEKLQWRLVTVCWRTHVTVSICHRKTDLRSAKQHAGPRQLSYSTRAFLSSFAHGKSQHGQEPNAAADRSGAHSQGRAGS